MLNLGWRAAFAAICLCSLELAACADVQQYVPWSPSVGRPLSEGSSAPPAATPVAPEAQAVASPTGAQPPEGSAHAHTAKNAGRIASERAAQASNNALKASKQAALASKEAAGAVAVSQPGAKVHEEAGVAKPGSAETPSNAQTPVVTLGDVPPVAPPLGYGASASVDSPTSATGSASVATPEDHIHLQADQMIHEVSEASKKIDTKRLDSDEKRRQTIALRLLKSAEKSYTDQDYSAAYSLALKASILLKPLPETATSASP